MATTKGKAGNKAAEAKGKLALKGFAKSKMRKAFETMAGAQSDADASAEAKQAAALDVVAEAVSYRETNAEAPAEVVAQGWGAELRGLALELAIAGNRFAELREGKDGEAATAKLTGYGNNVASIAKGAIEFELTFEAMPEGIEGVEGGKAIESYREVRKVVEALRAQRRAEADPEGAKLAEAKDDLRAEAAELVKLVCETGDVELIRGLTDVLSGMRANTESELAEQAALEAEAEAEAEAA